MRGPPGLEPVAERVDRLAHAARGGPPGVRPEDLEQLLERHDAPALADEVLEHLAGPVAEPLLVAALLGALDPRAAERADDEPRRQVLARQPGRPGQPVQRHDDLALRGGGGRRPRGGAVGERDLVLRGVPPRARVRSGRRRGGSPAGRSSGCPAARAGRAPRARRRCTASIRPSPASTSAASGSASNASGHATAGSAAVAEAGRFTTRLRVSALSRTPNRTCVHDLQFNARLTRQVTPG